MSVWRKRFSHRAAEQRRRNAACRDSLLRAVSQRSHSYRRFQRRFPGLVEICPVSQLRANTFVFNPVENITQDQYIFRIDHTFNQNNVLWGSAAIEHFPDTFTLPFLGANLPGFGETDNSHTKQITVAFNHSFSPNTLNEARVGYSRLNFASVFPTDPAQPSSFGFTGITPQSSSGASAPLIGVTGFFTLGFSGNGPQPRIVQNYQFTDNFSKIIGKHSLKAGFEMRRYHVFNPFSANNNGAFTFGATGRSARAMPGLTSCWAFRTAIPKAAATPSTQPPRSITATYRTNGRCGTTSRLTSDWHGRSTRR